MLRLTENLDITSVEGFQFFKYTIFMAWSVLPPECAFTDFYMQHVGDLVGVLKRKKLEKKKHFVCGQF